MEMIETAYNVDFQSKYYSKDNIWFNSSMSNVNMNDSTIYNVERDKDRIYRKNSVNNFSSTLNKKDIYKKYEINTYFETYNKDIDSFKEIQGEIMEKEIPILTRLLLETSFDIGYESVAEKYFNQLVNSYGIFANTILQNIFLQHMYDSNYYLLEHLMFLVGNISKEDRNNLELIPLAGLANPNIEVQDLSVKCIESWEDRRHLRALINLKNSTHVTWFKDYLEDVIEELSEK